MGTGLGASGASLRAGIAALDLVAPGHVASTPPLARAAGSEHVTWLVFEILGALLGGVVAADPGRLKREVLKGPRIGNGALALALAGGVPRRRGQDARLHLGPGARAARSSRWARGPSCSRCSAADTRSPGS